MLAGNRGKVMKKFHKREAEERRNAGYDRTKIVMQIIKSNVRRKM